MSAERMREAAKVLREHSTGAHGAWGESPWQVALGWREGSTTYDVTTPDVVAHPVAVTGAEEVADYIATMHPGVGLPLADWLDEEASRADERQPYFFPLPALAVADAILGGQS